MGWEQPVVVALSIHITDPKRNSAVPESLPDTGPSGLAAGKEWWTAGMPGGFNQSFNGLLHFG